MCPAPVCADKFGKLESWYFNSSKHKLPGQPPLVKRKRDATLRRGNTYEKLIECFTAGTSSDSDLVATWVTAAPDAETSGVLHLTRGMLERFLRMVPEKGHGVLQQWVAPFGGRQCLLRTDWSPHHFGVELRTNWHTLTDHKQPVCQRLATFEGGVRHATSTFVINRHLQETVGALNASIAARLDAQRPGTKCWRLLCTFKPGADGFVYLAHCHTMRRMPTDETGFLHPDVVSEVFDGDSVASPSSSALGSPRRPRRELGGAGAHGVSSCGLASHTSSGIGTSCTVSGASSRTLAPFRKPHTRAFVKDGVPLIM